MKKRYLIPAAVLTVGAAAALAPLALFSLTSVTSSKLYHQAKRTGADGEALDAFLDDYRERMKKLCLPVIGMTSFDGLKLYAHWYPAKNAKRTIVLVHGWRSSWDIDFAGVTDYLHESGSNLLFIEQRAQGESEGVYMTFGILERFDVIDWVKRLPEFSDSALPVYLFGVSMGATTVLMASGLDLPESVRGIVADCGFTSPRDIIRYVTNQNTHLPGTLLEKGAGLQLKLRTGFDYSACSALDAVKSSYTPTLFVHGGADTFVPFYMTCRNYIACAAPKSLLIVPGAGHAMSFLLDPESYKHKIEALFAQCEDGIYSGFDIQNETKGENTVKKTIKIEGMMCAHCQSRVKKALESIPVKADVSFETGLALVEFSGGIPDALLKETVEKAGYTVVSID